MSVIAVYYAYMSSSPLGIGLIGCGRVTEQLHLPALRHVPDARVTAAADRDAGRLDMVTSRFGILRSYLDADTLLADPDVDIVAVCVPVAQHAEVAIAALDAGKHVLIEKPLSLTLDEADRLMAHDARSPGKATVGFNLRHHRLIRRVHAALRDGALGTPAFVRSAFTSGIAHRQTLPDWRRRRATGGGVLFELGVHHFDLWRYLLDAEVEEVFVQSRTAEREDDMATVSARLANGVLATGVFSQATADQNQLEFHGSNGRIVVSCYQFDGLRQYATADHLGGIRHLANQVMQPVRRLPAALPNLRYGGDFMASYRSEWQAFIDCIRQDHSPPATLSDGRRALQITLAALESAATNRPVSLQALPRDA